MVNSNSTEIIVLELCVYALILSALLFGNLITLLVLVLNRRMRTVPNMFVASLAINITDLSVWNFCKHFIVVFGNNFPVAFWRRNVPVPGFHIGNLGIGLDSHYGIDGGE